MAAQQPPREPSMEEILASIRRIIAEDGPNPEVGRPAAAASSRAPAAPAPGGAPLEAAAPEVLDLTEMLEEAPDEPLELTELDEVAAASPPAAELLAPVSPPASAPAESPPAPEREPLSAEPPPAEAPAAPPPAVAAPEVVSRRAAPPPPLTPPPEPAPLSAPPVTQGPAPSPAVAAPPVVTPPPPPRPPAELVPPRTQEKTTAALGELARAVRQDKQRGQPSTRSPLEALVLEALRPSLKAWLEQNLTPLVERVVREEVRRLARRVEDQ